MEHTPAMYLPKREQRQRKENQEAERQRIREALEDTMDSHENASNVYKRCNILQTRMIIGSNKQHYSIPLSDETL